jgi:hypothetical protein
MYVYIPYVLDKTVTNNYDRIITRLYALLLIGKVFLEKTLIKDLLMIPKDQLISFSVGTSGRRF